MFDQTFVNTGGHTNKPWSVAVSLAAQGLLVGTALIVPILHPELLHPKIDTPLWVHLQPVKNIVKTETTQQSAPTHSALPKAFVAPTKIPDKIARVVDTNIGSGVPDNLAMVGPGTGLGTQIGDILSNILPTAAPVTQPKEPAKPAPLPVPTGPVSVSSGVQAAKLIYGPKPAYPPLARAAHVQGTVKIQAIIGADGSINSLQVMSGPPLLIAAAKDAVSRWRYQATLLNSKAVEVITEIDVIFTLGN